MVRTIVWLVTGALGFGCVPDGKLGLQLSPRTPIIFVDGGFDELGNPVDGGVTTPDSGTRDTGPRPDLGLPETVLNPVYDNCPDLDHTFEVPIIVNDATNSVARSPAVTSFLVPFAESEQLYSLNSLIVMDAAGARLPAQFEALSRWGGHPGECTQPIRYAYAHVRAVPAPGSNVRWTVRSLKDNSGESTPLVVREAANAWSIDTGAARFMVRRDRFEGLSLVELSDGQGGYVEVSRVEAGSSNFFLDREGLQHTANLAPWYLVLERKGPQVVTVAARGYYANSSGTPSLAYTIRLNFVAGSAAVRVDHTYYYGEVENWGANGATNVTLINKAWMQVPFAADALAARAETAVSNHAAAEPLLLEQEKRSPNNRNVRWSLRANGANVATGRYATQPFVAASGGGRFVAGTIARMDHRDPQGLAWDPQAGLQLLFTSSPMQVGGARGIWSVGAVEFGTGDYDGARGTALLRHAERPLLGTPAPEYVNTTRTLGPYAERTDGVYRNYFTLMAEIHNRTKSYLDEYAITGLQLWPDLPRDSCHINVNCDQARGQLHEGGDNNYWNWSKPGIDEFFRTGNNDYLYDFSLGEAVTYAETLAFRTYHDRVGDSSVAGLAACYGDSRGYSGDYREGLNNRRDRCVPDYSYDKTLKVAYLATADARFVDFFEEAAQGAINAFGAPPVEPDSDLELTLSRLSEQRLELVSSGAEFTKDPEAAAYLWERLRTYATFMLGRVLIDGHSCNTGGSGHNDAKRLGTCNSGQAWMMPVGVEWALRTGRITQNPDLENWVRRYGERTAQYHAVLDGNGIPNFSVAGSQWRTIYQCSANGQGVVDSSCAKFTGGENNSLFYQNGLMAYLNVFGLVLAADPTDPQRICQWLPQAYATQLTRMNDQEINGRIWGKSSGQAFGMSAEAVGALSYCR